MKQPLHETNLSTIWGGAISLSALLLLIERHNRVGLRLALVPRPGLMPQTWLPTFRGLISLAPLLVIAVVVLPALAIAATYVVRRARRVAFSSRMHGSFTEWWAPVSRRTSRENETIRRSPR
ncbi:MAG TPA: hypothetical protein VE967_13110 [Gemmatimonadaceae bacterium]|nr:hypothetical protein [Gemmatimonadaceae bacterium]